MLRPRSSASGRMSWTRPAKSSPAQTVVSAALRGAEPARQRPVRAEQTAKAILAAAERDITSLSAGLDEVPEVYKDIDAVMAAQTDLVDVVGRFDPKLVKMCPSGERAED